MSGGSGAYAVMTVDAGKTTGCARGVFVSADTLVGTMRGHRMEAWEVACPVGLVERLGWPLAAWEIAAEWLEWTEELFVAGIAFHDMYLVLESFQLRQRNVDLTGVFVAAGIKTLLVPRSIGVGAVGGDAGLSPRAGALAPGLALPAWNLVEQTPGDAMRWTSARLKRVGLFALGRGSEHKRDALRHLALFVSRYESS